MIRTENLVKTFGKGDIAVTVLKGIDININPSEWIAIIGPSGAGKSTLLYQLSLLDRQTSGEIYFDDRPTSALSEAEKTRTRLTSLGYVFQDYALLPELTAFENVLLPMLMQGMALADAEQKARRALERVMVSDKMTNLPSQLSGGQQQRVAIARAIAHEPRILFADEPTANLDSVSAKPVMDAFASLHRDGQTIIMVTHEEEYAKRAERIITIKDGVIIDDHKQ